MNFPSRDLPERYQWSHHKPQVWPHSPSQGQIVTYEPGIGYCPRPSYALFWWENHRFPKNLLLYGKELALLSNGKILLQADIPKAPSFLFGLHIWLPSRILFDQRGLPQKGTSVVLPAQHPFSLLLVIEPQFSLKNTPSSALSPCVLGHSKPQASGPASQGYISNPTLQPPLWLAFQAGRWLDGPMRLKSELLLESLGKRPSYYPGS